jgi:hypothetical protein
MDIVSAMADPNLFGRAFRGPSWDGWRAVLKGAFALPMSGAERAFFRSVADREPPSRPVRECWFIAGRRAGKDSIASLIVAHAAALFEGRDRLRGGERPLVLCLAVDREQAGIVLNYCRDYFTNVPLLSRLVRRETADGFELSNGVDIAVGTSSYRTVRGRTILAGVMDEVSFWRQDNSASPDKEVFRAIRPGMVTLPNSMLIGITSAYRRSGLAYERWLKCYGRDDPKVLVIKAASTQLNPTIDQQEIDDAIAEDPAAARAEWLSEWRDDLASYLSRDVVEATVERGVAVRPPRPDVHYAAFCDPSGGMADSFTAAVAHKEGDVAVLDWVHERRAPFNPTEATAEIAAALHQYRITEIIGDRYAAAWVTDAFARHGVTLRHSERDRSIIYLECLPLFTSGRARLLDHAKTVSQFAALERRTMPGGRDRIDHPQRGADDVANAVAGALVAVSAMTVGDRWVEFARRQAVASQQEAEADLDLDDAPRAPPLLPAANPLMDLYLSAQGGAGAAEKPPPCAFCKRPTVNSRVTDGVRNFCNTQCEAAFTKALVQRNARRADALARSGLGRPLRPGQRLSCL